MNDPGVRASDADREYAAAVLQREVGTGRLTLDEFSARVGAAYRARTLDELAALTADLPRAWSPRPHTDRGRLPVPVVLALVLALALLLFVGPAVAGIGEVLAQVGTTCH